MLEFKMPDIAEDAAYWKTRDALEKANIPFGNTFQLKIKKGSFYKKVERRESFKNLFELKIGCKSNPPSIYQINTNPKSGTILNYKRKVICGLEKIYDEHDNTAKINEITRLLCNPDLYYEMLSVKSNGISIKLFRDPDIWRMNINGNEKSGEMLEKEGYGFRNAVILALDFYQTSNL